jgi:hypothetical protein
MTARMSYTFRFRGSNERTRSPYHTPISAAEHAMLLHTGRWPAGVRELAGNPGVYCATGRGAKSFPYVIVEAVQS